jgi:glycosyltransferase involved in cell wall biosynthesis
VRICIVGTWGTIPPVKGGGIEAELAIMAQGLVERGHEVSIVCANIGDRSKLPGVGFYKLKALRLPGKGANKLRYEINEVLYGIGALFFLLTKRKRFDLIHINSLFPALLASLFKPLIRRPMVYALHTPYPWDVEYEQLRFRDRVSLRLKAYCVRKMCQTITPSARIRENIIKYIAAEPGKVRVIYHAVDRNLFNPKYGKEAKHTLGLSDDSFVVLFAGRLVEPKGVEYLLRAVPIVKKEVANARFVLVGGRETGTDVIPQKWLALCKELDIEDDVTFTGSMTPQELGKTYPSADIFALPTMRDIFCLTVAEAMCSGLPVISTDCADIPLFLNGCGIVVNKGDQFDLANAIIKLAKNKELRERYSKKAIAVAEANFSVERFIAEHERVCAECLGRKALEGQ